MFTLQLFVTVRVLLPAIPSVMPGSPNALSLSLLEVHMLMIWIFTSFFLSAKLQFVANLINLVWYSSRHSPSNKSLSLIPFEGEIYRWC